MIITYCKVSSYDWFSYKGKPFYTLQKIVSTIFTTIAGQLFSGWFSEMLIFLLNLFSQHFYPTCIDFGSFHLKMCFVVLKKWQTFFFAKPSLWKIDTKNVWTTAFFRVLTNNYFWFLFWIFLWIVVTDNHEYWTT